MALASRRKKGKPKSLRWMEWESVTEQLNVWAFKIVKPRLNAGFASYEICNLAWKFPNFVE